MKLWHLHWNLIGGAVIAPTQDGIWLHKRGSGTRLVVKAGDPTPGLPGLTFEGFDQPILNEKGMVVFRAWTTPGDDGL